MGMKAHPFGCGTASKSKDSGLGTQTSSSAASDCSSSQALSRSKKAGHASTLSSFDSSTKLDATVEGSDDISGSTCDTIRSARHDDMLKSVKALLNQVDTLCSTPKVPRKKSSKSQSRLLDTSGWTTRQRSNSRSASSSRSNSFFQAAKQKFSTVVESARRSTSKAKVHDSSSPRTAAFNDKASRAGTTTWYDSHFDKDFGNAMAFHSALPCDGKVQK